jgi:pimeloyl-ACP methyl ester carboxylesterase
MERPRLLLVPMLTEVEWVIKPQLEEWADVATYDAPGIGDEPAVDDPGSEATARRGLDEADRLGWERFVVVADEFGVVAASHLAVAAGDRVQGLALGHARLSNSPDGPRPAINREVLSGIQSLIRADNRTFVMQVFKMTGGEGSAGGYREELMDEYVRRVPLDAAERFYNSRMDESHQLGERLSSLDVPMLLAQHKGCLMFTAEGFEDAVAALPHARTAGHADKPSTSVEFAEELREFCASLAAAPSA